MSDHAERTRPEHAPLTSDAYLRAILNNVPYLVWLKDRDGKFLAVNDLFARSCGRQSAEDVIGKTDVDLWPADLANKYRSDDADVMATRKQKKTEEPIAEQTGIKWFETFKTPILDENGEVIGTTGVAQDITERRRAEAALRASAEMLNAAPSSVTVHDTQGRFLYANRKTFEIHGYDEREFMALNVRDLDVPESAALIEDRIRTVAKNGEAAFEVVHLRKDRTTLPMEVFVKQVEWDGIQALLSVATDITKRKRAEAEQAKLEAQLQQAQKMESVGRLAGGVAHDFNNMLTVIIGYAALAMKRVNPAERLYADLLQIRDAANRSADLTRQLLAFARKQTVAPEVLDLNDTVAGVLTMLHRLIGENIDLRWRPGTDLWRVRVDPSQIDQILANLCVNARDAISGVGKMTIETGNITIDEDYCGAHAGCAPGRYVRLAVSDDGCGMDKETLSHLFEPFFTTKAVGEGTGLGLATVYGVVRQNDGFINVYSEPNHGTTFTIYLPRHHAGEAVQAFGEDGAARPSLGGQETILLVEDEPAILRLTTTMLEQLGYTVLAASTPGEAIDLARTHTGEIHLLMTDVVMPEMNGRVLAKNLLSIHPLVKRLFMSGYTADVIAHHGVLDEGLNFIQKPFSLEDLATKVRAALDAKI